MELSLAEKAKEVEVWQGRAQKMKDAAKDINSQDAVDDYIHAIFPFTESLRWNTGDYKDAREFVSAALKYDPDERKTAAQLLKMRFVAA